MVWPVRLFDRLISAEAWIEVYLESYRVHGEFGYRCFETIAFGVWDCICTAFFTIGVVVGIVFDPTRGDVGHYHPPLLPVTYVYPLNIGPIIGSS